MKQKSIELIWDEYIKTKNKELKMLLIEHYVHLVKIVAGRLGIYLNQYIDNDDLVSYGVIGLIDAIDKFDKEKNVKFETYASLRIRGAILDEIRKLDWIPRTLRKKQKDLDKAYMYLENKLGRPPHDTEIAEYLNISVEEYYALVNDINIAALISIDEYPNQVETIKDTNAELPYNSIELQEQKEILKEAINKLPEREKQVILLYYYEELTLKEISHVLEVSESRISQLHTKGVSRLRMSLSKYNINLSL